MSHHRPFLLSGGTGGGRIKNFKGTFTPFTYETAGPHQPLGNDNALAAHRWRNVDHRGAPSNVHRGVTGLRARSTEQGVAGTHVPIANATLAHTKDHEWHPNPYSHGGMRVQDNFRQRDEGLAGVKARQRKIASLHNGSPFSHGANINHTLFDPAIRSNARDYSCSPDAALAHSIEQTRVPHRAPFRGSGMAAASGVGAGRAFISGHPQFPYHYSDYRYSEQSLADTKISNSIGSGFRMQCEHAIHYPMKATTSRTSRPSETDRNPNLHAIQAHDETCRHRCNDTTAEARQQFSATQPLPSSNRF